MAPFPNCKKVVLAVLSQNYHKDHKTSIISVKNRPEQKAVSQNWSRFPQHNVKRSKCFLKIMFPKIEIRKIKFSAPFHIRKKWCVFAYRGRIKGGMEVI